MLYRPPIKVAETAQQGIEHAAAAAVTVPPDVRQLAEEIASRRVIDADKLHEVFAAARPGWKGDTDRDASIVWLMLGGAASEGWLPTIIQPAQPAVAAAPETPRLVGVSETIDLFERIDGFIRAAIVSAVRRVDGRVVNKAGRISTEVRAAAQSGGMPELRTKYPSVAATLTAQQEDLVRNVVDEHEEELIALLLFASRQIVTSASLGVDDLWEQVEPEFEASAKSATVLFRERVERYVLDLLSEPDELPADVDDGFDVNPSAAIAAGVLAVLGGTPIVDTADGPVAASINDALGVPDVSVLAGPTIIGALQRAGRPATVAHEWHHRSADANAFTIKDGVRDHHAALNTQISTSRDGFAIRSSARFPKGDFYRASDHPDGPDHKGCRCIVVAAPVDDTRSQDDLALAASTPGATR